MNTEKDSAANARRSVIHIGLHKVASTTLQHSLYDLRKRLAAQGFLYPVNIHHRRSQHSDLAILLREGNTAKYRSVMDTMLLDLRASGDMNLLLSGEEFSMLRPRKIEQLYGDLARTGRSFRVVLYIRNLYRLAISAIAERSKTGHFIAYPGQVLGRRAVNPSTILSRWEQVFGADNVIAECLEALPPQTTIVSHFAQLAGARLPRKFRVADRNRSIDPIASVLLSHLAYEFRVPHRLFYKSYFAQIAERPSLPRTDTHLVRAIGKWVAGVDLSHPKLARFEKLLRGRPPLPGAPNACAQSAATYLRQLSVTLMRTAEGLETPKEQPEHIEGPDEQLEREQS